MAQLAALSAIALLSYVPGAEAQYAPSLRSGAKGNGKATAPLLGQNGGGQHRRTKPYHPAIAEHILTKLGGDEKLATQLGLLPAAEEASADISGRFPQRAAGKFGETEARPDRKLNAKLRDATKALGHTLTVQEAAIETSKHLTSEKLQRNLLSSGGRRAQGVSESASPSTSAAPTATRTPFLTASVSPLPSNVTRGGTDALEGVWTLQPGIPVNMYVEPGA